MTVLIVAATPATAIELSLVLAVRPIDVGTRCLNVTIPLISVVPTWLTPG